MVKIEEPQVTPVAVVEQSPAAPVQLSADEVKLTNLRYLVLAGEEWPECDEECEFFTPKIGWEAARGCHAHFEDAMQHVLRYPDPEFWHQVVDLYTMSIIFTSYDECTALH